MARTCETDERATDEQMSSATGRELQEQPTVSDRWNPWNVRDVTDFLKDLEEWPDGVAWVEAARVPSSRS